VITTFRYFKGFYHQELNLNKKEKASSEKKEEGIDYGSK